jgi:hypothetical protein
MNPSCLNNRDVFSLISPSSSEIPLEIALPQISIVCLVYFPTFCPCEAFSNPLLLIHPIVITYHHTDNPLPSTSLTST